MKQVGISFLIKLVLTSKEVVCVYVQHLKQVDMKLIFFWIS